jgi:hypothetical protein
MNSAPPIERGPCRVNVARAWIGPEYRRREIVGSEECGHPERRHEWGVCYDCDDGMNFAGMLHGFSPEPTDKTGWVPEP